MIPRKPEQPERSNVFLDVISTMIVLALIFSIITFFWVVAPFGILLIFGIPIVIWGLVHFITEVLP